MITRSIRRARPIAGGLELLVEESGALVDGSTRTYTIEVAAGPDMDPAEVAAMAAAMGELAGTVRGAELKAAPATRQDIEGLLPGAWARWQRWQTTRVEAEVRALPAAAIAALTARENAAWTAYRGLLQRWIDAPP